MNYQELYRNTLAVAKGAIRKELAHESMYRGSEPPSDAEVEREFSRRYDLQCAKDKEGVTR